MCGIVGFVGEKKGVSFVLAGLKSLKYRGYDSAGISVFENGKVKLVKKRGKLEELEKKLAKTPNLDGNCVLGHTRWATHGKPSDLNSHPIQVNDVVIVHNGIIENYLELKRNLQRLGYSFKTDTDTEVAAALIDSFFDLEADNCLEALQKASKEFKGTFALGVVFSNHSDLIYAVRRGSALLVGLGQNENYLASDVIAFSNRTKKFVVVEENEFCVLSALNVDFFDSDGNKISKQVSTINWNVSNTNLNNFDNFMMKEIFEQPEVVARCFKSRIVNCKVNFNCDDITKKWLAQFKRFHVVACGTAMHAGLFGKHLIENLAKLPVEVSIASEFRYCNPIIFKDDLVVIVSQSGETADSLAALRLAKKQGVKTLAIVNVKSSSIAREASKVIFTDAGPEISVASTKAFSSQLAIFYLLAICLAEINKTKSIEDLHNLCEKLLKVPKNINLILEKSKLILNCAKKFYKKRDIFFIGRGVDYFIALESSLKLKELSYIHSEAYAAGELKHGTISLIEDGVLVISIATQTNLFLKTLNNVKEVKARGARVIILCSENANYEENLFDFVFELPFDDDFIAPFCAIVFMQLFACNVAVLKGCDVDMPRNLAKSVTVE